MSKTYKLCEFCGQPAVLTMEVCQRCGRPYTRVGLARSSIAITERVVLLVFVLAVVGISVYLARNGQAGLATSPRTTPRTPDNLAVQPAHHRSWTAPAVPPNTLMTDTWTQIPASTLPVQPGAVRTPPDSQGSGLTTDTNRTATSSSLFTERQSSIETPTIHVTSLDPMAFPVTIVFWQPSGQEYRMVVLPGGRTSIKVPSGDYWFEVISNDANIRGTSGDATFRRYHAYDLYLATRPAPEAPENQHIGDN